MFLFGTLRERMLGNTALIIQGYSVYQIISRFSFVYGEGIYFFANI